MYVQRSKWKSSNGKVYETITLRESYRESGKVKKRTIAKLTHCPPEDVTAIELAIKHKKNLHVLSSLDTLRLRQGASVGAVWVVHEVAKRLHIEKALGSDHQAKLAMWQIIARVIDQGSRLSAVRLAKTHAACDVLQINRAFDEDALYRNLGWLASSQESIEKRLYQLRYNEEKPQLMLYDVTSSYLEGNCNAYAAYGYNRDKKRGKKQIVIGMLCDDKGDPISTEVFRGNTQDVKTFSNQVDKAVHQFGCRQVTYVGDRGMIKSQQIKVLQSARFHYITAITKPQIEKLIRDGILNLGLFDENVAEIAHDGIRYVLKRNPVRAKEIATNRQERLEKATTLVDDRNAYLETSPKAKVKTAVERVERAIIKLNISKWVSVSYQGRILKLDVDEQVLEELSSLDGCYAIKTDLSSTQADKHQVHDHYKDLTYVETAFRDSKTVHLELRPIYVRREDSTEGHVLVVMLSYMIVRAFRRAWKELDVTVQEGLDELKKICAVTLETDHGGGCLRIPEPSELGQRLLDALSIQIPQVMLRSDITVDTRHKLSNRRRAV